MMGGATAAIDIRPVTLEEFPDYLRTVEAAAGFHVDDDVLEEARAGYRPGRYFGAFDGSRMVGGAGFDVLGLTLPGPVIVPTARATTGGVVPTHRRRGIFALLLARLFDEMAAQGLVISIGYVSDGAIYRRFGYGPASFAMNVEIDRRRAAVRAWPAAPGQLRLIGAEEAAAVLPAVFDEHRMQQHGQVERPRHFWRAWLEDPDRRRRGAGRRFLAVARHDDRVTGYVSYRHDGGYPPDADDRALIIEDLIACDGETRAALWRYCLGVDLVRFVRCANVPVDEPARWLMEDVRALRVRAVDDFLWLRPLDVSRTLASRRYGASDSLTIGVDDRFVRANAGCYRLDTSPGLATCARSTLPPDIRLDVAELGTVLLGGVRFAALAGAGRVVELSPGSIQRADAMFGTVSAPWTVTDW